MSERTLELYATAILLPGSLYVHISSFTSCVSRSMLPPADVELSRPFEDDMVELAASAPSVGVRIAHCADGTVPRLAGLPTPESFRELVSACADMLQLCCAGPPARCTCLSGTGHTHGAMYDTLAMRAHVPGILYKPLPTPTHRAP